VTSEGVADAELELHSLLAEGRVQPCRDGAVAPVVEIETEANRRPQEILICFTLGSPSRFRACVSTNSSSNRFNSTFFACFMPVQI